MQPVLCDTSVFLALWAPDEKSAQMVFSKRFFDEAGKCIYSINALDMTRDEILCKFPFLLHEYVDLCKQFFDLGKFKEYKVGARKEILSLKSKARQCDYNLSFNDCALVFAALKLKMVLLSWDKKLLEFAEGQGANAKAPDNL
jgi:predicted nucleic acid-binding protein